MAVIPTGLGWEADENYLKQYAGKIGVCRTVGGASFPGQPIPKNIKTVSDLVANGYHYCICTTISGYSGHTFDFYIGVDGDEDVLVCSLAISPEQMLMISTTNTATIHYVRRDRTAGTTGSMGSVSSWTASGGLYYLQRQLIFSNWTPQYLCPVFSSRSDALAAVVVTEDDLQKANDGYCVVAWVKYRWQGGYGEVAQTPVLISTLPAAAEYDSLPTGIVPSGANYYYQGAIFRMCWLYNLPGGSTPFGILTLDYTGSSYGELTESELFPLIARAVSLRVPIAPDPYGGGSGPGGGTGGGSGDGTPVPHPTAPTISAVDTGLVTLYVPTLSELQALSQYLWSGLFDIDTWRKIFADPMDAILGLMMLPVAVPAGSSVPIRVGNQSTTVSAARALGQYVTVSCGSITLGEDVGCYLDYDPYTQISMYLPYIGFVPLKADDCIGRTLSLQYIIDALTGACVATLAADGSVVGSWAGNCCTQIPITGSSWNNVISGALSVAATAATLAAGATAVAPLAVAGMANTAINSQKPVISRSGSLAGSPGFMGVQIPYLIVTRPRPAIPSGQNQEIGYPSYINELLGNLMGYTIVDEIHLTGIPCTQDEMREIEELLSGGVIL